MKNQSNSLITFDTQLKTALDCLRSSSLDKVITLVLVLRKFYDTRLKLALRPMHVCFICRVVTISACARSHPTSIALRYVQRRVLMSDPNWNKGFYYNGRYPRLGMKHAR